MGSWSLAQFLLYTSFCLLLNLPRSRIYVHKDQSLGTSTSLQQNYLFQIKTSRTHFAYNVIAVHQWRCYIYRVYITKATFSVYRTKIYATYNSYLSPEESYCLNDPVMCVRNYYWGLRTGVSAPLRFHCLGHDIITSASPISPRILSRKHSRHFRFTGGQLPINTHVPAPMGFPCFFVCQTFWVNTVTRAMPGPVGPRLGARGHKWQTKDTPLARWSTLTEWHKHVKGGSWYRLCCFVYN